MDIRKLGRNNNSFERSRSASKSSKVSTRNLGKNLSKRSGGERVQRTFSRLGKKWMGTVSDDRKAEQMFSQYHTHVRGHILASQVTPPDVRIDSLTRKVLDLDNIQLREVLSVKVGRESPSLVQVILENGILRLKRGKKKQSMNQNVPLSPKLSTKKSLNKGNEKEIFSMSRLYDLTYNSSRPVQFKARFYSKQESSAPKFTSVSIRLKSNEQCEEWLRKFILSAKQMYLYMKNLISTSLKKTSHAALDMDICAKYGRCYLDLGFWLYGYVSKESVRNIEMFEELLSKADIEDDDSDSWKDRKADIIADLEEGFEKPETDYVEKLVNELCRS